MNVTYDKFNTGDVAKIIGVSPQTITCWVRNDLIKATNISDGTEKARYLFTDEEVTRVQSLIKKYGTRKWMLYSKQEIKSKQPEATSVVVISTEIKKEELPQHKKFDADKIMNKILKLQDLKERLEDLEAERNQLINEIEAMRNEIKEVI